MLKVKKVNANNDYTLFVEYQPTRKAKDLENVVMCIQLNQSKISITLVKTI